MQGERKLLRVCRPGGKIGLANWTPDGYVEHFFSLLARYDPSSPADLPSPLLWGTEKRLHELLGQEITTLQVTRRSYTYHSLSPESFVTFLTFYRTNFGPVKQTFAALNPSDQERLAQDLALLQKCW